MLIQNQIDEKKKLKSELILKMEQQKQMFLNEMKIFVGEWFKKETLNTIKKEADKLIELGESVAKEIKEKINELISKSNEIVEKYLKEENIWWHTNEDYVSYYHKNRLPSKLEKKIREMLGELGKIFIEYKLIAPSPENSRMDTFTCWVCDGYNFHEKSKIRYGCGLSYSDVLIDINGTYIDYINEVQKINTEIRNLEDKLKKENIEDFWNSL